MRWVGFRTGETRRKRLLSAAERPAIRSDEGLRGLPVVLITVQDEQEDRLEGLTEGADAYLAKPFHPEELRQRVENLIGIRQYLQSRSGRVPPSGEKETSGQAETSGETEPKTADGDAPDEATEEARAVTAQPRAPGSGGRRHLPSRPGRARAAEIHNRHRTGEHRVRMERRARRPRAGMEPAGTPIRFLMQRGTAVAVVETDDHTSPSTAGTIGNPSPESNRQTGPPSLGYQRRSMLEQLQGAARQGMKIAMKKRPEEIPTSPPNRPRPCACSFCWYFCF